MKSEIVDRSRRCSNLRRSFFGRSIIRSSGLVVILVLGFFASPVQAQDAQFANANQDYAQAYFKEAVDGYNQLVRSGHRTANLFYDLGNAYFRMGDPGHAVLNYE